MEVILMDSWKYDAEKGWIRPRDDTPKEETKKSKRMRRKKNAAGSN